MANLFMIISSILLLRYCTASSVLPNVLNTRFTFPSPPHSSPSDIFEIKRPIVVPEAAACSVLVLQQDFANSYSNPLVSAPYTPPSRCEYNRIILEWSASSSGIQYDRIIGIWLSGVELLRSSTAEPSPTGIRWSVSKEVTRYASLFSESQTLTVSLGNIVDEALTGIYRANVSFHFYADPTASASNTPADLVLPISRTAHLSDGLWFHIQSSKDLQGRSVAIPGNAHRAVIELYVSFHGNDEFWYSNVPNSFISKNNLTSARGNGAFREVIAMLDGNVVGAVWPFPVIYSGSFNPDLWRPAAGIGSFDLPSYDLEITPFLGELLDGQEHSFQFRVEGANDFWLIDANLHLWIEQKRQSTRGGLIDSRAPASPPSVISLSHGLNGHFSTSATRKISSIGWVESSHGNITTKVFQKLIFKNKMKLADEGNRQSVKQIINNAHGSSAIKSASLIRSERITQSFPLSLLTRIEGQIDQTSYTLITNISSGFNEKIVVEAESNNSLSDLRNLQSGHSIIHVKKNMITSGQAAAKRSFSYHGTDDCYLRNTSIQNNEITSSYAGDVCPTHHSGSYAVA